MEAHWVIRGYFISYVLHGHIRLLGNGQTCHGRLLMRESQREGVIEEDCILLWIIASGQDSYFTGKCFFENHMLHIKCNKVTSYALQYCITIQGFLSSYYKMRNLCGYVFNWPLSRTAPPIDFNLGRCVAGSTRKGSGEFCAITTHKQANSTL